MKNFASTLFIFSLCLSLFAQGNGEFTVIETEVDGLTRQYTIYQPEGYDGSETLPVVFMLHSYNGSMSQQIEVSGMYDVADTAQFFVVYPEGLLVDLTYNGNWGLGRGWNVPAPGIAGDENQDDVAFIENIIEELVANPAFGVDLDRIYASGFSIGSIMTFYLACELSDQIAAVAGVAGPMSKNMIDNSCDPIRPISALYMLGTSDFWFPELGNAEYASIEEVGDYWASINNCNSAFVSTPLADTDLGDNSTVTLSTYEGCGNANEVLTYTIDGGTHTWPGGWVPWGGVINNDINASVEIWNFFSRHQLESTTNIEVVETGDIHLQTFPNPASDQLNFTFDLPQSVPVSLVLSNALGQSFQILSNAFLQEGPHQIAWQRTSSVPTGWYSYQLFVGEQLINGTVVLNPLD